MEKQENRITKPEKNLTDKDFYDNAYNYFSYHAGQRTNMINYFIGVFGAAVALYGALISYPVACACISGFMLAVSVLFLMIDIRTKFDIKHSEKVLCQIERDYGVARREEGYPYGVFSNESNIFTYYDHAARKAREAEWKALKKAYQSYKKGKLSREALETQVVTFMGEEKIPMKEVLESLEHRPIVHLSTSIAWLYWTCIFVSVVALGVAVYLLVINGPVPKEEARTALRWIVMM